MKLIKESFGESVNLECGERCRLMVVLDKCVSRLNHEEYVLLRRSVKAAVIRLQDANSLCRCSVHALLPKKGEHGLVPNYHLSSSNIEYGPSSRVRSQEI